MPNPTFHLEYLIGVMLYQLISSLMISSTLLTGRRIMGRWVQPDTCHLVDTYMITSLPDMRRIFYHFVHRPQIVHI